MGLIYLAQSVSLVFWPARAARFSRLKTSPVDWRRSVLSLSRLLIYFQETPVLHRRRSDHRLTGRCRPGCKAVKYRPETVARDPIGLRTPFNFVARRQLETRTNLPRQYDHGLVAPCKCRQGPVLAECRPLVAGHTQTDALQKNAPVGEDTFRRPLGTFLPPLNALPHCNTPFNQICDTPRPARQPVAVWSLPNFDGQFARLKVLFGYFPSHTPSRRHTLQLSVV